MFSHCSVTKLRSERRQNFWWSVRRYSWRLSLLIGLISVSGCAQEMMNQPRVESQEQASRPIPEHTVPTSHIVHSDGYETGQKDGELVAQVPNEVLQRMDYRQLLNRGRQRFNISCVPCHDRVGSGKGMVARRGLKFPPSYHIGRLREQPIGYVFNVATNGRGEMPGYGDYVSTDDRWAIAAYVKALQLSQQAVASELSASDQERLK